MNDKEILPMLEELKTIGNKFIFTVPGTERATHIADYERIAQKIDIDFISFEDVIDAYIYANKLNEPLLITGSFYLAGEVLKYLKY
jgi:folylpolyglutamate synthase/dihydropteroate synthase